MQKVLDYAFRPHPSTSALESFGVVGVGRYVSESAVNDTNGKNLIPSENASLRNAGIPVILFAEEGAQDMLGGRSAGVQRAQHFKAVINADNIKRPHAVMVCTADFDATPGEQAAINAYLEGAKSVLDGGIEQVALYGGYYPVSRALSAGVIKYAAQTFAWSRFSAASAAGQGFQTAMGNEVFFNLLGNPYTLESQQDQGPTHSAAELRQQGVVESADVMASLPSHAVLVTHVAGLALPGTFLFDARVGLRQGPIGTLDGASVDHDEAVLPFFCQDPAPEAATETYREWITKGNSSLEEIAQAVHQPAMTILRQTVAKYDKFDNVIYAYGNGVFDGSVNPTDKIPAGGRLWVRAS